MEGKSSVISMGGTKTPTLVYGTTKQVLPVKISKNLPKVDLTKANKLLEIYNDTGQLPILPKSSSGYVPYINKHFIDRVFMDLENRLPNPLLPYIEEIFNDYTANGMLGFVELPDDNELEAYGVAFILADSLEEKLAEDICARCHSHAGFYPPSLLSQVLDVNKGIIKRMQSNNSELLGELVHSTPNGIENLANAIVYHERDNLTNLVGCHFNWENEIAYAFRYGKKNYFAYLTY